MPITLDEIYGKHKEWLYIEDTKIIDLKLATEIARQIHCEEGGKPLWIIIVAPSGSAKSEFLETLLIGMPDTTYDLRKLSPNVLVSGNPKAKDLAPDLNGKLVIVSDSSRMTCLYGDEKNAIFTQLRDLYDGYAGKHVGMPTGKKPMVYSGLKVTMLWGAVPAIEKEVILQGELGTRFLLYYFSPPNSDEAMDMMQKRASKGRIEEFKRDTGETEYRFLREIEKKKPWQKVDVESSAKELMNVAKRLSYMRATADIDWYTGVTKSPISKEEPTRAFGQFRTLYRALMSLSPDYPHERAMEIIRQVAYSSGSRMRSAVFDVIKAFNPEVKTSTIAEEIRTGYVTVRAECYILWALGLVEKKDIASTDAVGRQVPAEAWSLSKEQRKLVE